jgi:hypothetical protein
VAYAKDTKVSVAASVAEIEATILRYDGTQFWYGLKDDGAVVGFTMAERQIQFRMTFGLPTDEQFTKIRRGTGFQDAPPAQARARWDQRRKELMRSLALVIKAKLEAAESGVETIEEAFMAQLVLPDGSRVGDMVKVELALAYESGRQPPHLLPDFSK